MLQFNYAQIAKKRFGPALVSLAILFAPLLGAPRSQGPPRESTPSQNPAPDPSDAPASKLTRKQRFEQEKQRLESGEARHEALRSDPGQTLFVTPAQVGMLVGDEQQFSVFDLEGHDLTAKAQWSLSNSYVVDLNEGGMPMITAKDHGEVSVRVRVESQDVQAEVKVYPGDKLALGTVRWQAPTIPGYHYKQMTQAVPTANGPDLYAVDESDDGKTTLIRALYSDGRQKWMKKMEGKVSNITPH